MFCAEDGTLQKPMTVYRQVKRLFSEVGLDGDIRSLRTFFATGQDRQNTPPDVSAAIMGHSRTSTTRDHYIKPGHQVQRDAVGAVLKMVRPNDSPHS